MLIPKNEIVRIEPLYGPGHGLYSDPFNSLQIFVICIYFFARFLSRYIFLSYNRYRKGGTNYEKNNKS